MKHRFSFFPATIFLLIGLIVGTVFVIESNVQKKKLIEDDISFHLAGVSDLRIDTIKSYLSGIKKDISVFAKSSDVRGVFMNDLVLDENSLRDSIREQSHIAVDEIEGYLLNNPGMTIEELQKDTVFQKIAVRKIGHRDGYTAVQNARTLVPYFHVREDLVGTDVSVFADELPDFWKLLSSSRDNEQTSGFYSWKEKDGSIREKYMHIDRIGVLTADNIELSIATTAYIDEYKFFEKVDEKTENYFTDFMSQYGYYDILFISKDGYVGYTLAREADLGTNLELDQFNSSNLALAYRKAKEINEAVISSYDYYAPSSEIALFAVSPVFSSGDVLGYVAFQLEEEAVNSLVDATILSDFEDTYLVDSKLRLLTPSRALRGKNKGVLTQIVNTPTIKHCFSEDYEGYSEENGAHPDVYRDFKGDYVFGNQKHVSGIDWCLLVEIDKQQFFDLPLKKAAQENIIIAVVVSSLLALLGFFAGSIFEKKCVIKVERK